MKTTDTANKSNASNTHSTKSFIDKTGDGNFFPHSKETGNSFLSPKFILPNPSIMKKDEYIMREALAEREREVTAINVNKINYVLYQKTVHVGGSSSWLANNPGNLDYTEDTKTWGAYADKHLRWGIHPIAIFPSVDQGLFAVGAFLRKHQIHPVSGNPRTIKTMMLMFAPVSDNNRPDLYAEEIAKDLGVSIDTEIVALSDDQLKKYALSVQRIEGWIPGNIYPRDDSRLPPEVNAL